MSLPNIVVSIALILLLVGCAELGNEPRIEAYAAPAELTPATGATITMGPVEGGFFYALAPGSHGMGLVLIDGKRAPPPPPPLLGEPKPLLLPPGDHALLVRAFRDPIADYACMHVSLAAGHTYVVNTTTPELDFGRTLLWIEDKSSAELIGQKFIGLGYREPGNAGVLIRMLTAHPEVQCPVDALPATNTSVKAN